MAWTDSRFFHSSRNANVYEVIERGIRDYYPHVVVVSNEELGIDEIFGEGYTRRAAFNDLRKKIGITIKRTA